MDAPAAAACPPTVVALLCGLPASGKSTLAKWLVANNNNASTRTTHIEYDQVEDDILATTREDESYARDVWKQSRSKSIQLFREQLLLVTKEEDDTTTRIILMDDNFHLRSMRREVYRLCQDFVQSQPQEIVYFMVLWLDTPPKVCLERNQNRPRPVPEQVVDRMSTTLEPPGKEPWEQCFLRIQNLPQDNIDASELQEVLQFLTRHETHTPVPPPPPPIDPERLEEERRKTRESWLHGWDQRLRKWVGLVAQVSRRDTGQANKARKALLVKLREVQQGNEDLPSLEQVLSWFLEEMKVSWSNAQTEQFRTAATLEEDGSEQLER